MLTINKHEPGARAHGTDFRAIINITPLDDGGFNKSTPAK